jgi:hypothetical protein
VQSLSEKPVGKNLVVSPLEITDPEKVQNGRKHWLSCHWPWSSPCKQPSSPTVQRSALARKLASGERPIAP